MSAEPRIVVIGAGPTGLGAAHRLCELGHRDFDLYEASAEVGGLARSVVDEAGFTWDMGGHVQFSHYRTFDALMERWLGDRWLDHERHASVWMRGRFVSYPLQHHLGELGDEIARECRRGLSVVADLAPSRENFRDWIVSTFGAELADLFMLPYNRKVWACDPSEMSVAWIGERVASPQPKADQRRKGWGPNRSFRFPAEGGTGEIWRWAAAALPSERLHFKKRVSSINARQRRVHFDDGSSTGYDHLVSSMPLTELVTCAGLGELDEAARALKHSSVHVVGIGLEGRVPLHLAERCWIYFPEDNCPFYRVTVFSRYAPANVPNPQRNWSLLCEVSESADKAVDVSTVVSEVVSEVIDGLLATGLIESSSSVVSRWHTRLEHGYPTPTLGRDDALSVLLPALEREEIYSRGRFGAWKYEVSNQDHSLMQGIEVIDRLLGAGRELTLHRPDIVNAPGKR